MGKVTSSIPGEHITSPIEGQVKEGFYDKVSDVVAALRAALVEGEESGASTPFDFEGFISRKLKVLTAR